MFCIQKDQRLQYADEECNGDNIQISYQRKMGENVRKLYVFLKSKRDQNKRKATQVN